MDKPVFLEKWSSWDLLLGSDLRRKDINQFGLMNNNDKIKNKK